jgi:hypothetical protein
MSFWEYATGPGWLDAAASILSHRSPVALQGAALTPPQPWGVRRATPAAAGLIAAFWCTHFHRSSAWTHRELKELLVDRRNFLLVVTEAGDLVGTVLATPLGSFGAVQGVHYIDMLCVAASHRSRGVARALLFAAHHAIGRRPAIFLKEGRALGALPPLHSGSFAFRRVATDEQALHCQQISTAELEAWLPPNALFNKNPSPKSKIVIYKGVATAAFTWANQTFQGQPLIWMTGFVCKDAAQRAPALLHLSTAGAKLFNAPSNQAPYVWAWDVSEWTQDGPAHLYAYNWNPGTFFRANPFIVF